MEKEKLTKDRSFNPNRPYHRTEIDLAFTQRKALMHQEALKRGKAHDGREVALYQDCYTGKMLRGGDRYDYEHILSAEAVFDYYKATHTNEQIAMIVNHPDNVGTTLRTINQYKGKYDLVSRILDNPAKMAEFDIDAALTKRNLQKAQQAVFGNK